MINLISNNIQRLVLISLIVTTFATSQSTAQEPEYYDYKDKIGNWALFRDENTCWMATRALFSSKENLQLEKQMLYITFFNGSPDPKISFYVPECCDDDASAKTQNDEMMLVWFEDFYYPNRKDDDEKLLMSLMNSHSVTVIADETDEPLLWFSLSGMRDAYSEVARTCEFHPLNFLRDADYVYKG